VSTRLGRLIIGATILLSAASAQAQTAPTCSFDAPSATLTVTLNGVAGSLTRTGPGQIRLGTTTCTGATVTSTDTIIVNGGDLNDQLTLAGSFAPGLTPEGGGGVSEIEIVFSLGAGTDTVRFNLTAAGDTLFASTSGFDVGGDLDEDITTGGSEFVKVYGFGGDDLVDVTNYVGGGKVYLYGGLGNDTLIGSSQADWLYGDDGNDTLAGAAGADRLYGGQGNDDYYGDAGNDIMYAEATADGDDSYYGGTEIDTVNYQKRTLGVEVTMGDLLANDGQPGAELDYVEIDMEYATGGAGDDLLVGDAGRNILTGNDGNDDLFGGGGNDSLRGGLGDDSLVGDDGGDTLNGDQGNDSLDGGVGPDNLFGGTGIDTLNGGAGTDEFFGEGGNDVFFNNDGVAETVDCGTGLQDDAEADPLDTLVGCEV
jgi:Ca2+-binding RTX toxin-like protein